MSRPEDPTERADSRPQEPAETRDEVRGSKAASLLDAEIEAPINAAVQDPDFDDRQGRKEDRNSEDEDTGTHDVEADVEGDDI